MSTKETALLLVLGRIPWAVVLLPATGAQLGPHVLDEPHFPTAGG